MASPRGGVKGQTIHVTGQVGEYHYIKYTSEERQMHARSMDYSSNISLPMDCTSAHVTYLGMHINKFTMLSYRGISIDLSGLFFARVDA